MRNFKLVIFGLSCMLVLMTGCSQSELNVESSVEERPAILAGSFIQPWLFADWKIEDWREEFGFMKEVRMDHVIFNWTVKSDDKAAWYPSKLGFEQVCKDDQVLLALKAAKDADLKVWLGLNITNEWWKKGAEDEQWLKTEFGLSKKIAQELWDLYGGEYSDTIAGFYLTLEMWNSSFKEKYKLDRMAAVYGDVCDYVHANMDKPVMVAPFWLYEGVGADEYAAMWAYVLETAAIDVIAMQDGVGCDRGSAETVGEWFAAMRKAVDDSGKGTQLWSDLETMRQVRSNEEGAMFVPAKTERILEQIEAERNFVEKFTSFSFNHYQSPKQRDREGYDAYRAYVEKVLMD